VILTASEEAPAGVQLQTLAYRALYHKGFGRDDVDRYGPALELVQELHRRIELVNA